MTPERNPRQPAVPSGSSRRLLKLLLPCAGAVLLIAGILLLARGPGTGTVDFAWVVYTPDGGVADDALLINRSMMSGALLVLSGAVVLAFWSGFLVGRRRRPTPPASPASRGDGQPA